MVLAIRRMPAHAHGPPRAAAALRTGAVAPTSSPGTGLAVGQARRHAMNPIEAPTVADSYGHAWTVLWRRFPELLLTSLLWAAVALPGGVLHHLGARLPSIAYHLLVGVPATFGALVGAGFVLLVVPGIWIATRLAFVGFLVVDEGLDAPDAVRESWRRTQG